MTPDSGFMYLSDRHSAALAMLQYGVLNRAAITLLTGDVGSGKTTLIRALLSELNDDVAVGLISNTHESFGNLMQWISVAFGLHVGEKSKAELYEQFASYLIERYAEGRRTILIVDEAQNLQDAVLEELRLTTNINADKDQVLQLVLVGQPELRDRLRSENLIQFVQRVGVDYHLTPLAVEETRRYIAYRVIKAGGSSDLFNESACKFVHYQSSGVPRMINSICDTSLVYGFARGAQVIDAELVYEMVIERIDGGLFGAGDIRFDRREDETPEQTFRRVRRRARRRATNYLRKACDPE